MVGEYNGFKKGITLVVWDNPWSSYVEFNIDIKIKDPNKPIHKVFDKGNSIMDKVLKGQEYGRAFYHNPRLGA